MNSPVDGVRKKPGRRRWPLSRGCSLSPWLPESQEARAADVLHTPRFAFLDKCRLVNGKGSFISIFVTWQRFVVGCRLL